MRTALLLVASLCLPGCATLWGIFEVAHVDWQQGESTTEEPAGPAQRRVRVSAEYQAPAPIPAAPLRQPLVAAPQPEGTQAQPEAQPQPQGQAAYQPPPAYQPPAYQPPAYQPQPEAPMVEREVPPPGPRGALKLSCVTEQRISRVHVRKELYRYDGIWKVLSAFMFLAEGGITAGLIGTSISPEVKPAPIVVGSIVGLDAIAVAILFWHAPETLVRTYDADGTWRTESPTCPDELAVDTGAVPAPVRPDGTVGDPDDLGPWLLNAALFGSDTAFQLRLRGKPVERLTPLPGERCEWAAKAGQPRPWCDSLIYWKGAHAEARVQLDTPLLNP